MGSRQGLRDHDRATVGSARRNAGALSSGDPSVARSQAFGSPKPAATLVDDVDFTRGVVHPKRQWPDKPLKTQGSDGADSSAAVSSAHVVGVGAAVAP